MLQEAFYNPTGRPLTRLSTGLGTFVLEIVQQIHLVDLQSITEPALTHLPTTVRETSADTTIKNGAAVQLPTR